MSKNPQCFNDYETVPASSINLEHLAFGILCDTSISLNGRPIENLLKAMNRFADDVCKDKNASECVDICVMEFNDSPSVVQDWRPIKDMNKIELTASGGTNISAALDFADKKIRERTNYYKANSIVPKKPHLLLITDGYGGDVTVAAKNIMDRTYDGKLKPFVLCVKGYDKETVAKLAVFDQAGNAVNVFELNDENGYDFTGFFDFMSVSLKSASTQSADARVLVDDPTRKDGATIRFADIGEWMSI